MTTEGPEGEAAGEDGAAQTNGLGGEGINGAEHEQDHDMANGDASQQDASASGAGMRGERQPNKVRVTTPYLTKYERARVLGTRALQIR